MTPKRWQRIDEVFAQAAMLARAEREPFVQAACQGDANLYDDVMALLASDDRAGASLQAVVDGAAARVVAEPLERLAERFAIRRELGAGGMGIVYEAFDEVRGELVALKTLPYVGARQIADLKREFRSLVDVAHPNLVRLHELFCDRNRWFFTMERIQGVPFVAHVRSTAGVNDKALRAALRQLCDGVIAIHAAGKLHRDLKPSNVLVTPDGRVTILDFGLARNVARGADASLELGGAGTPAYMAPEQMRDDGACAASDWYAIGGIIYEALTGQTPYGDRTTAEIIAAKHQGAPPMWSPQLESAPRDLAQLAQALLAHDPAARPVGAAVLAALGDAIEIAQIPDPSEPEPVFIGREHELAALDEAFGKVVHGEPTVVYVSGASGMGKTALLDRFLASIRDRALVLRGRCYERENVPYKALDEIVDALARHMARLDRVAAAKLTPRHAGELCRVFPVLGRITTLADEPVAQIEPKELRWRAFQALREVLARLGARKPIVIAIDDLQWSDADSALLLAELVRPPDAPRVLWLGAYRSEDRAHIEELPNAATIDLAPLGNAESRELAASLIGDASHGVDEIASESAGIPFFIRELSRRAGSPERAALTVSNLVAARVARLPDDARRLLEVVAIAGRPVRPEIALEAAELSRANDAALPILRTADLVRTTVDGIVTYHDRIRETAAAALDSHTRALRHRALADALVRSGSNEVDVLALHYYAAGDRGRAFAHAKRAAALAAEAAAFERAAEHCRMALELVPAASADESRQLERALGDALAHAGRCTDAAEAYLRAMRGATDEDLAALERKAMRQLLSAGDVDRGGELARKIASRAGVWFPRGPRVAMLLAMLRLLWLWLFARGRLRPRDPASLSPRQRSRLDVERELFDVYATAFPPYAYHFGTSLAVHAWRWGDSLSQAYAVAVIGALQALLQGRVTERTERMFRELSDHTRSRDEKIILKTGHGASQFGAGNWATARGLLVEAHQSIRELPSFAGGDTTAVGNMLALFLPAANFYAGEFAELTRVSIAGLAEAHAKSNLTAFCCYANWPQAWLARDDAANAQRELDEAEAASSSAQTWSVQFITLMFGRGYLALYRHDPMRGYEYFVDRWSRLRRSGVLAQPSLRQFALFLRASLGLAAAIDADDTTRTALWKDASACLHKLQKQRPHGSRPLAQLLCASLAHARGRDSEARALLERAIAGFDATGMRGYAAAARYRLGKLAGNGELVVSAEQWFRGQTVADIPRFVGMLAPGFA